MTTPTDSTAAADAEACQSSLEFDPVAVLKTGVRVNVATFARMMGVSKQAASGWKSRGLITLGSDGLVNPTEAARQLMRNADPTRLRAKVLKAATADTIELHQRIRALEQQLAKEQQACADMHVDFDELDRRSLATQGALNAGFDQLIDAYVAGCLPGALQLVFARHLWELDEQDLHELRADLGQEGRI